MSEPGSGPDQDFLSQPMGRRGFLRRAGQAGAAVAMSRLMPSDVPKENPPVIDSWGQIREFVAGNKGPITFEPAQALLPHIANAFAADGSPKPAGTFFKNTLIVAGDPDAEATYRKAHLGEADDPFNHPTVQRLLRDYPGLSRDTLTVAAAQEVNNYNFANNIGNVDFNKILIFLSGINNTGGTGSAVDLGHGVLAQPSDPLLQFTHFDQTSCQPATPSVALITTALHEMFHYEADDQGPKKPLKPEVVSAFQAAYKRNNPTKDAASYRTGSTTGLRVFFESAEDSSIPLLLGNETPEEFVSQYLTTQLCLRNGLPAMSVRGLGPVETSNFAKVLAQSGISEQELRKIHAEANVKEFLLRIAKGAKNVDLETEQDMLQFSLGLLLPDPSKPLRPWAFSFQPYFPSINLDYYQTADYQHAQTLVAPGCGGN